MITWICLFFGAILFMAWLNEKFPKPTPEDDYAEYCESICRECRSKGKADCDSCAGSAL